MSLPGRGKRHLRGSDPPRAGLAISRLALQVLNAIDGHRPSNAKLSRSSPPRQAGSPGRRDLPSARRRPDDTAERDKTRRRTRAVTRTVTCPLNNGFEPMTRRERDADDFHETILQSGHGNPDARSRRTEALTSTPVRAARSVLGVRRTDRRHRPALWAAHPGRGPPTSLPPEPAI
jgi:hypothetical protein